MRLRPALRPSDPGRFALRLAVRTGIVLPAALALGLLVGTAQTALFASFGTFALLVFADFGGPRPTRLLAFAVLALTGAVLVALGTVCSRSPVLAAAVMLVVGFAILFGGVVNGYFAAGTLAALLTYVLPAMVPAETSEIGMRLLGWGVAIALCVPATFLVLPARPHDRLRATVAAACRALSAYLRDGGEERRHALDEAVGRMRECFAGTPYRPSGPTGATGAVARMVVELDWLRGMVARRAAAPPALPPTPGELALRARSAEALDTSAALVERRSTRPPDREALDEGRARVFEELIGQIGDARVRDDAGLLAGAVRRAWDARVVSYVTLQLSESAMVAAGDIDPGASGPRWLAFARRQGVALAASGRVAAAHADVRSVWFRNSLRGAIGLAAAVLLAGELSVQHAFWVVLGSLSVLRSSALNTGATILQALAGTLVGIVVGGLLVAAIGSDRALLWVVLPLAGMLAAYAPRAVSFAAGQAGFTVAVLVIFNLLAPGGWEVGLVRLEDVSLGFAISLGVGLLLWPRGAADAMRRALDDALTTGARYAGVAARRLGTGARAEEIEEAAADAEAAEDRLDIAIRQRLAERSGRGLRVTAVAGLAGTASRLRFAGGSLEALAEHVGATAHVAQGRALAGEGDALAGWYARLGASVAAHADPPASTPTPTDLEPTLLEATRDGYASGARDRLFASTAIVWGGMHLEFLHGLEAHCAEAARALAGTGDP